MSLVAQMTAIAEQAYLPGLPDNIYNSNPLFFKLKQSGNIVLLDGGRKIVQPLQYAKISKGGSYADGAALDITPNDIITDAEVDWKYYYVPVSVTRGDELKNMGKHQIVDLVDALMKNAKLRLEDLLGTGIFSDASTSTDINGLRQAVDSATTYAGIAVADFAGWASQEDSTTAAVTIAALRDMRGKLTIGADKPDIIVTTQYVYDDLYNLLQPQQRFVQSNNAKQMASAGFDTLEFEGIPVVVDSHCPSQQLYMLNSRYIKLCVHKNENFRFTGFKEPIDQNAKVGEFYWAGNLIVTNRRMHGKFTALPAT